MIGFGQAGHRQAGVVADEMAAGGLETRAAEAEDLGVGHARRSSAASAPAYRSPDASPQEIMILIDEADVVYGRGVTVRI